MTTDAQTQRTESLQWDCNEGRMHSIERMVVDANDYRILERENAALQEQLREVQEKAAMWDFCDKYWFPRFINGDLEEGSILPSTPQWTLLMKNKRYFGATPAEAVELLTRVVKVEIEIPFLPTADHSLGVAVKLLVPAVDLPVGTVGNCLEGVIFCLEDRNSPDEERIQLDIVATRSPN